MNRKWAALPLVAAITEVEACGPNGKSAAGASGTWTGTISAGSESLGIRFAITDSSGSLSGEGFFADPVSGKFDAHCGSLTGSLNGGQASWTTVGKLVVSGNFDGDRFKGTLQFPLEEGAQTPVTAALALQR